MYVLSVSLRCELKIVFPAQVGTAESDPPAADRLRLWAFAPDPALTPTPNSVSRTGFFFLNLVYFCNPLQVLNWLIFYICSVYIS